MKVRPPLWLMLIGTLIGGCQTLGNLGVETSAKPDSSQQPALAVTGGKGIKVGLMPWESTYDPYQYADIRPGTRPSEDTLEAGLWMQVEKMDRETTTAGNRIRDPKLEKYLRDLTCRLAGPYCADTNVFVQRVPFFNANMVPNGTMRVWSGLLLRVRNEAQLVAVLGHEIGHYIRRHGLQRIEDLIAAQDFLAFLSIGLAVAGAPAGVNDLAGLIAAGSIKAHGRDHERESDLIGITLMHRNGYNAREAAKVWARIIRERDASENTSGGSLFLASHPPSKERQNNLEAIAAKLQETGDIGETGEERYRAIVGPLRRSFLEDEVRLGQFETTLELLKILYEDGFRRAEIKFYEGEVYRRRAKTSKKKKEDDWSFPWSKKDEKKDLRNDHVIALEIYDAALKEGTPPPEIYRSIGLVHHRMGNQVKAQEAFQRYLELVPDATDRKVIQFMIKPTS